MSPFGVTRPQSVEIRKSEGFVHGIWISTVISSYAMYRLNTRCMNTEILLDSQGHQRQCSKLHMINTFMFSMTEDFRYCALKIISVWIWPIQLFMQSMKMLFQRRNPLMPYFLFLSVVSEVPPVLLCHRCKLPAWAGYWPIMDRGIPRVTINQSSVILQIG